MFAFFHCRCLLFLIPVLYSCKKNLSLTVSPQQSQTKTIRSGAENATTTVYGNCNYLFNESSLTSAGWTKVFEDEFNTDLAKWNIWTGGAYNNELQYYQAGNLRLSEGV